MDYNDRELMARTLQAEAGNQGYGGLLAAGSVIMNRANMPGYGDGVRGAILKPGQFSAWNSVTGYAGGEQGQDMANMRPSDDAYRAADALLSGNYQDPTGGATHYYNPSISNPAWGRDRAGGDWQQIGDHIFGFADAGRGGNPRPQPRPTPQARPSTRGAPQMAMQPTQRQPRGLLETFGVQRQDPTAQDETALPFYQRDAFRDTMGNIAIAANSLTQRPDANVARNVMAGRQQRKELASGNRTIEWLRSQPDGERFAQLAEAAGPQAALQAYQQMQAEANVAPDQTALMQNYEYALSQGMSPEEARQWVASGNVTNINTGAAESAFDVETAKILAQEAASVVEQGSMAQRSMGQIESLSGALERAPSGAAGSMANHAANIGIKTEGASDIELANAIISQLVPQQRPPGSGVMSDADLELFKQSLPRLINTREGNRMIINTMRSIAEYDIARGEIARRQQLGQIGPEQAASEYAALGNPIPRDAILGNDANAPAGGSVIQYDADGNRIQ